MTLTSSASTVPSFEIKSAQLPLVALVVHDVDVEVVLHDMQRRFGDAPDFFDHEPLLLDLTPLDGLEHVPALSSLMAGLRDFKLCPLAFRGGSATQRAAAQACGLVEAKEALITQAFQTVEAPAPAVVNAPAAAGSLPALVVDKPLRSGQQVYARGRDLVVMAMVNPGAEVIADGHIHVYAPLRGKAIAGARGLTEARIFAQSLEPELISIAGVYRTSDVPLPASVHGKPAHIRLHSADGDDKLLIEPIL
jgi:septum site-determining protein MinC